MPNLKKAQHHKSWRFYWIESKLNGVGPRRICSLLFKNNRFLRKKKQVGRGGEGGGRERERERERERRNGTHCQKVETSPSLRNWTPLPCFALETLQADAWLPISRFLKLFLASVDLVLFWLVVGEWASSIVGREKKETIYYFFFTFFLFFFDWSYFLISLKSKKGHCYAI